MQTVGPWKLSTLTHTVYTCGRIPESYNYTFIGVGVRIACGGSKLIAIIGSQQTSDSDVVA